MASDPNIITIEILGTRLQLRGGENPDAVRRAAEYVRDRVHELANRAPAIPPIQLVLLTAINIANEVIEQTTQDEEALDSAVQKASRILSKTRVVNS